MSEQVDTASRGLAGDDLAAGNPPGLDLAKFEAFLQRACPGTVGGPLRARVIAGGKSNLTYEVTDGSSWWIVRRPPLGHVLATAHDMTREYRVISALQGTDVPVPQTFALCEDPDVVGAPFYVMQRVDGTPYRHAAQLRPLGVERVNAISTRMVDALAALHRVDPAAIGLSDFGRPDGFLTRQVRRWRKQLDASRSRDLAGAEQLHALLEANMPTAGSAPAIVHGDYRLDNLLVDRDDQIAAVIDWEMATIGDPLTDVALLLVYQRMPALDGGYVVTDACTAPGFITDTEILRCYAAASGRDLSRLGFHLALAYFKIAVILEGIHYRHTHGQTVGQGFETIGTIVEPLIAAGLTSLKEHN
ncbi:phosphotransferase family protein [Micromonospora sp. NBC_01638]|uniref:phosphotransferase family protein n=1 Tax=Micromonospora sp. NBC_01638 TaxID=2975982 RepID=UPI00386BC074|nr:phosphotransferase family protein [Micromonospora sp. NBC_01638]